MHRLSDERKETHFLKRLTQNVEIREVGSWFPEILGRFGIFFADTTPLEYFLQWLPMTKLPMTNLASSLTTGPSSFRL